MESNENRLIIRDVEPFMTEEYFNDKLFTNTGKKSLKSEINSIRIITLNSIPSKNKIMKKTLLLFLKIKKVLKKLELLLIFSQI